jgi:sulfur-oxidizing protein SoxY
MATVSLGLAFPALAASTGVTTRPGRLFGLNEALASSGIELNLPDIAQDGSFVPVSVRVHSPMTPDNYVKRVHIRAEYNPFPDVVTFHFTPKSGRASASTRIRLATTQNVVAVAELSDGSVMQAQKEVVVVIGGCRVR